MRREAYDGVAASAQDPPAQRHLDMPVSGAYLDRLPGLLLPGSRVHSTQSTRDQGIHQGGRRLFRWPRRTCRSVFRIYRI